MTLLEAVGPGGMTDRELQVLARAALGKTVLEFGPGHSTLAMADTANQVTTVERWDTYWQEVQPFMPDNVTGIVSKSDHSILRALACKPDMIVFDCDRSIGMALLVWRYARINMIPVYMHDYAGRRHAWRSRSALEEWYAVSHVVDSLVQMTPWADLLIPLKQDRLNACIEWHLNKRDMDHGPANDQAWIAKHGSRQRPASRDKHAAGDNQQED